MKLIGGHTLIELLIVVGLTFVILLLVTQRPILNDTRLLHEVFLLKTTCHNMQQLALASGEESLLVLHMESRSYEFDSLQGLRSKHEFAVGVDYGFIPGVRGPPAYPTSIIVKPCTFELKDKRAVIRFFPSGGMSSGTLYLVDNCYARAVALTNAVSGQAALRIYELDAEEWKELKS